jgi:hypothetical protein
MADEFDKHQVGDSGGRISRRAALRHAGTAGIVATLGMGLMEVLGASPANAKQSTQADTRSGARRTAPKTGQNPCCATAYLSKGDCGGPCPSGYWCYYTYGCGVHYVCLQSSGQSTTRYCTSIE